jgi:hypothetical protein
MNEPSLGKRIIDLIKDFGTLVGVTALILGLVIKSPDWKGPIRVKAQNPIVVVDVAKFHESLKKQGVRNTNFVWPPSVRFVVYPLEWYSKISATNKSAPERKQLQRIPNEWIYNGNIIEAKKSLGYKDRDFEQPTLGESHYVFDNQETVEQLRESTTRSYTYLWRITQREMDGFLGGYNPYDHDPFYESFEKISDRKEKAQFYGALLGSAKFISWFVLANEGGKTIPEIRLSINLAGHHGGELFESVLQGYNITIQDKEGGFSRLRAINLAPGPLNYKTIVVMTNDSPIKESQVRLDGRDFVVEIADYYRWILAIPLLIMLAMCLLGYLHKSCLKSSIGNNIQ